MRIRVDPFILRQNSGSISGIGGNVIQSGQNAFGIARGAPNIDGQFGPQVQAIGNEALVRAQGLFSRMNDLSNWLQSRAQAFEAADMAGIAGFVNVYNKAQILAPWLKLTGVPMDILNRYLMLGGFFVGTSFYGLLATLIMGNNLFSGNRQTSGSPITKPSTTFGDILKKTEKQEALKKEQQPVKSPQPAPSPSQQSNKFGELLEKIEKTEFQSPTSLSANDSNNLYFKFGDTYPSGKYKGDRHPGIDIKADKGEPVHPIGAGKVVKIGNDPSGYGRYVVVEHEMQDGTKLYSLYAHLDGDSIKSLTNGTVVHEDSVIGRIGDSGNWGDAYHLHLEVRTEQGFSNWKFYSDAQKDDWGKYWLNPQDVLHDPAYGIKSQ